MIPLNWNTNIKTSLSIFHDKVLPLLEDYRIRIVAAAAFVVLSALFVMGVIRCIRGKNASKNATQQNSSVAVTHKSEQVKVDTEQKAAKIQSLEAENQRLKEALEAAKQVHTAIQPSDKKPAVESGMKLKVQELEDELLSTKSQLQESERKLNETESELKTAKAKWQENTKQSLKTQREQLSNTHQEEIKSLKAQIAAGQKAEDVKLLDQIKRLLGLDPKTKLDRKLKEKIFGKALIPPEAEKLLDYLRRSRELNRLANTNREEFSSDKFQAKQGIQESHQLIILIKSLLIEIKSLNDENAGHATSIGILSAQNATLLQKSEQRSMNVSQITDVNK